MMFSMAHEVLTEVDGRIGRITLNRPDAYNAITVELARSLEHALRELGADAGVNVIVIRGAGGNFSAGGDFAQLERLRATGAEAMRELFESFAAACEAIASLPVPVIAAVEGYAMAGGFELMQAADIALAREDARLADNHTNFGLVPGGGSSQRLPRLIGRQRALGLILTGDRVSGAEAAAWGLAYKAYPAGEFDAAVEELAERLAAKSRAALARCKRLVYDGLEGTLAEGVRLEIEAVLDHLQSDAGDEAFERFAARSAG
jgi:enoyl-CoA hydratase/carnithine racemase